MSQDHIDVFIGEGGSTLREIESRVEVRSDADSENGSVAIDSVGDPVLGMVAPDVVRAVGRGFASEGTMTLPDDDMMMFKLIDTGQYTRNKNGMRWQEGHLIGENGHIRELMEELMGTDVVIYGTTLDIIGQPGEIKVVRRVVGIILGGALHDAVYSFLERKHNELIQGFSVRQDN